MTFKFTFSDALIYLKQDAPVCRQGWYGKHYLKLHTPSQDEPSTQPYIVIFTHHGAVVPWLASQADLLAEDWRVLSDNETEKAEQSTPEVA